MNTFIKYSVKYVRGIELFYDLIAVVLHVILLASIAVFHCVSMISNSIPRADSFSIAIRFLLS
jgi:hypothetical protein